MVRGVIDTAMGAVGTGAKIGFGTAAAGISTGATYTGTKDSESVIGGVSNTIKTVDSVSEKLGQIGTSAVDAVTKDNTSVKVTRNSVGINRSGYLKDSVVNGAVDDEMKRRENIRNKMLGRRR